jgi:RNA polymerase sigma-70 factor (ECF subfamily)
VRDDTTSDEDLAARAARGDANALDTLLRRHTSLVHSVCRRVLGHRDDALDASQEALIAIARKIHQFDGRSRFSTWAYRVATNAALDEGRRRNRRPQPSEMLPDRASATGRAVDEHVADRLDIDAALETLSPDYRAAVALRDLVGMDYTEIGEVLGIPPGTVRSRIARGRAAVAEALGNREPSLERPTSGTT